MLEDFITQDNVQIVECVKGWKEAIQLGVQPLREQDFVDEKYVTAIIRNIEKYGSNFIISPYIILPHARPEEGVKKNGISILFVHKPFYIHNRTMPLKLMIILAPVNAKAHLQMLRSISEVLNDEKQMKRMLKSNTVEELLTVFASTERHVR